MHPPMTPWRPILATPRRIFPTLPGEKTRMSTRTTLRLAPLALALLVPACATTPGSEGPAYATLVVENHSPNRVTLYAIRGGTRHRIGLVSGVGTHTFELDSVMVGADRQLFIEAEMAGTRRVYESYPIVVNEGDVIEIDLGSFVY